MPQYTVEAPHKLLISGSYTVLDGHPAVALAVEPRLRLTLDLQKTESWPHDNPFAMAVRSVVEEMAEAKGIPLPAGGWGIFQTSTEQSLHGWGMGSSASFTVALLGAMCDALGHPLEREALYAMARKAHRRAQKGQGSGLDVAACALGGLILAENAGTDTAPPAQRLEWPEEIGIFLIRSGEKADTRRMIQAYHALESLKESAAHLALLASVRKVASALKEGQPLLPVLEENARCEALWSQEHAIPLVTPLQRQLEEAYAPLRQKGRLILKALGAGGGDSIGCFYDRQALSFADLLAPLQPFSLQARPVHIDPLGFQALQ